MGTLILKYQKNFADNLSEIAYGKILENSSEDQCYFENNTRRAWFEKTMSNFNLDFKYISTNQVKSIAERSYLFSRKLINNSKIEHILNKNHAKDKILDIKHFQIDNIKLLNTNILNQFRFKNLDFISNFDILEEVNTVNSIGLYIDSKDFNNKSFDFIYKSTKRLNKYIKKPMLYIFSPQKPEINQEMLDVNYKYIHLNDWREEFYFITQCKNKIILSEDNSYSIGLWSVLLNNKTNLVAFSSKNKTKNIPENWIKI